MHLPCPYGSRVRMLREMRPAGLPADSARDARWKLSLPVVPNAHLLPEVDRLAPPHAPCCSAVLNRISHCLK